MKPRRPDLRGRWAADPDVPGWRVTVVGRSAVAWLVGTCLLVTLSACGAGESAPGPVVTVFDSAGVTVYRVSSLPALDETEPWHLELERSIPTGSPDPTVEPLLYNPQNVLRLDDGTLVVLDAGEYRLAVISADRDTVVARFGRTGQGPGEVYSSNGLLGRAGPGAFWLLDPGNQRFTEFTVEGELVSERPATIGGGGGLAVQRPITEEVFFSRYFRNERDDGPALLTDSVLMHDPGVGGSRVVAPMPPRVASRSTGLSRFPYFAAQGWFAPVTSGGVVVGRSDGGELLHFSDAGALMSIIRIPMKPRAVSAAEKPAIIDRLAEDFPPAARSTASDIADEFPVWSQLWPVGDSLFALEHTEWATPAGDPAVERGRRVWRVFSVRGEYRGVIAFPIGFGYPYRIEADRIIGIRRDALGVGTIESYLVEPR